MKKMKFFIKISYCNIILTFCLTIIQHNAFTQDFGNPYYNNYNSYQTGDQLQFQQEYARILKQQQQEYNEYIAPFVNAFNMGKMELTRQYNAGMISKAEYIQGVNHLKYAVEE